jgi:hypothetical protein
MEYELVKLKDDEICLNCKQLFYEDKLHFIVKNYNNLEPIYYNIELKELEKNSYSNLKGKNLITINDKGFIVQFKENNNKGFNEERLSILITLNIYNNIKIKIIIDCILSSFNFKLLGYDYNKAIFTENSISFLLGKGYYFKKNKSSFSNNFEDYDLEEMITPENATLYFKVIIPKYDNLDEDAIIEFEKKDYIMLSNFKKNNNDLELKDLKIKTKISQTFSFQFNLSINKNIFNLGVSLYNYKKIE